MPEMTGRDAKEMTEIPVRQRVPDEIRRITAEHGGARPGKPRWFLGTRRQCDFYRYGCFLKKPTEFLDCDFVTVVLEKLVRDVPGAEVSVEHRKH